MSGGRALRRSTDWIRKVGTKGPPPPPDVDLTKPSVARVYDFALGGKDNFAVDRMAAAALFRVMPETPLLARDNRDFLRRAVRYLVGEAGIRQIIDIGCGLPTKRNIHEIAQDVEPSTRVLYADNDPVVLAHGRVLLAENDNTAIITADLRDPPSIFDDPTSRSYIDDSEPFAVLVGSLLHHLSDAEDPQRIIAGIRDRLHSGCYLVVTNFCDPGDPCVRELERAFLEALGTGRFRTWEEQIGYFTGLDLIDPGLVCVNDWRPDAETPKGSPVHELYVGGIGRQP